MKDDLDAFRRLYDEHRGFVRQVLYRFLGEADLDDAVQDCFFKVWKARDTYRSDANVRTWMYRIVTNHAIDLVRSRKRLGEAVAMDFDQITSAPSTDQGLSRALHEAVRALSPEYQAVIVGVIFEEMDLNEVATALGVPLGTVKSRLSRGRELLRQDLKRRGYSHE